MKRQHVRIEEEPKLMIIPMIDIIFFLLVFFMISTIYSIQQQSVPLSLPKTQMGEMRHAKPITINLTASGQLFVGEEEVSETALSQKIQHLLVSEPSQPFLIRADQGVVYGKVVSVLDTLKVVGAQSVSVATVRK